MAVRTNIYGACEPAYVGCVLDTYEHNGYHDSDFYAVCWDENSQKIVEVEYDTTRCGGGGTATIDATDEVIQKVYRYYKRIGKARFDSYTNEHEAKEFGRGDNVCVVRGRKVPVGTVGKVFWIGDAYNRFTYRSEKRVGIDVDGERIFLPADYVERADWQKHLVTGKERKRRIRNFAINSMPSHFRLRFIKWAS